MLKITATAIIFLSLTWCAQPSRSNAIVTAAQSGQSASGSRSIPSLKYCALVERSARYQGKQVRVTASWQFGFETSRLFDRECPDQTGAWLEFTDDKDSCAETKKNRDAPGPHDKEADVTLTGRLIGPGRYGHLGAYEYKFVVTCLEKIKVTTSDLK